MKWKLGFCWLAKEARPSPLGRLVEHNLLTFYFFLLLLVSETLFLGYFSFTFLQFLFCCQHGFFPHFKYLKINFNPRKSFVSLSKVDDILILKSNWLFFFPSWIDMMAWIWKLKQKIIIFRIWTIEETWHSQVKTDSKGNH